MGGIAWWQDFGLYVGDENVGKVDKIRGKARLPDSRSQLPQVKVDGTGHLVDIFGSEWEYGADAVVGIGYSLDVFIVESSSQLQERLSVCRRAGGFFGLLLTFPDVFGSGGV